MDNDEIKIYSEVIEKAYIGEHFCIQPPPKTTQKLTIKEKRLYDYIKSHPNYTMPSTCKALKLCQADYITIKRKIADKGYNINGVITSPQYPSDTNEYFYEYRKKLK